MSIITENNFEAIKPKTEFFAVNFGIFLNICLFLLACLALFLIILIKSKTATEFFNSPLLFGYTIFVTTFQLSRVAGAMLYKRSMLEIKKNTNGALYKPEVTFVIPCKNEEKDIAKTVSKCFEADYPKEKIEVIVINDGSTDNTLEALNSIKPRFENLTIIDWKINKGKRHGMAEGFKRAKGEIVVQLDSDSYIRPETFRHLIKIFENSEVGAVSVHTDPENANKNFLTKMQAAYYFMSFRISKAAESTFMTVFCCSGCASAYRKNIVLPILDEWLNEKFLGLPVTWGDDRALTNWVIKRNYKTIYSDEARAYTICPDTFKNFLKQQIRWKKGWFVNSVFASRFIYKKQPFVSFTYFFPLIFVTLATPFVAIRALIYNPIFRGVAPFYYIIGILLMTSITIIYYKYVSQNNRYWPYLFIWSAINTLVLSFILFYALFTIQNRKWGTR